MKYIVLAVFVCIALSACNKVEITSPSIYECELNTSNNPDEINTTEIQTALDDIVPYTPGVQVALVTANGESWTNAVGYADLEHRVQMEACHRLLIASITKVVTAVMIFQLQDEGILSVNDPLTDWLEPKLIDQLANYDKVTLRHLLNHTSGIPDYLSTKQTIDSYNQPFFQLNEEEKLEYAYGKSAENEVGEVYSYSNTNYVLLGLVVEAARGMELWQVVDRYIAQPLNLSTFEMGQSQNPIPADVARPYIALKNGKYFDITQYAVSDAATGDGGVLSNMQDLTEFIKGIFETQLISEAALNQMTTDLTPISEDEADFDWEYERYGLGMNRYNTPYGIAFGHTGFSGSYSSLLFYYPENGAILALSTNGIDASNIDEVADQSEELRDTLLSFMFK